MADSSNKLTVFLRPFYDSDGLLVTHDRRRADRRHYSGYPAFPMKDARGDRVEQNRRRRVDRRFRQVEHASSITVSADAVAVLRRHGIVRELRVDQGLTIGRSSDNDVVVEHESISRVHARLLFENGQVFLQDSSVNGTYFTSRDRGKLNFIKQERAVLDSDALIGFGRPLKADRQKDHIYTFSLLKP